MKSKQRSGFRQKAANLNSKTGSAALCRDAATAELCPNCGLCCDSTLFADVELRKGDDAEHLQRLGFALFQKTETRLAFNQPCSCFDGRLCRNYGDRPKRCRLFECGLLKKVQAGEMTSRAALKKISEAKTSAEKVRKLLRQSGQCGEQMALTHRYAAAMSAPIDFSKEGDADQRGELMLAVNELMQRLQSDFLTPS